MGFVTLVGGDPSPPLQKGAARGLLHGAKSRWGFQPSGFRFSSFGGGSGAMDDDTVDGHV